MYEFDMVPTPFSRDCWIDTHSISHRGQVTTIRSVNFISLGARIRAPHIGDIRMIVYPPTSYVSVPVRGQKVFPKK